MSELIYRILSHAELGRLGEIDRSETIHVIYRQQGEQLAEEAHTFNVPPWATEDDGEYSVGYHVAFCERHLAAGGTALGAFDGERLVGIGVVTPHVRPGIAQLALLHVSDGYRRRHGNGRLGHAVGQHGAVLHGSWLRAGGHAVAGTVCVGAGRRASEQESGADDRPLRFAANLRGLRLGCPPITHLRQSSSCAA